MKVSIVGTGYVGLVSAAGLAKLGHEVVCVDRDSNRVAELEAGQCPIHEAGLEELLAEVAPRLRATTDTAEAVRSTEVTMICVGTPLGEDGIDLSQIRAAATEIGDALKESSERHTVVVKSTVVPGTTEDVVGPLLEQASGRTVGSDIGLGMNPEFLREGVAVDDFMDPDRIVIGGVDDESVATIERLYEGFEGVQIVRTTPSTAEMIKYSNNALLATLISFSNEIANLAANVGVDSVDVMAGLHLDRRLSPRAADGTLVSPGILSYLEAGCGFGGSCFGKDVRALIELGRARGEEMPMLRSTIGINSAQPGQMVKLLRRHVDQLEGVKVAVLGIAFKPGTDDTRESPSLPVMRELVSAGAHVSAYDPIATLEAAPDLQGRVDVATDLETAIDGVDAIMLMTSWEEFRRVPALIEGRQPAPVVVDGRRMLAADSVPVYEAIGR
jgi:UDPglucose 6-dehydrogenase